MREGIKTSLLSIICAMATTAVFAAPAVRMVGGNGTYESAAAATAASRAGSLRTTGGYVRPVTGVSSSGAAAAPTTTTVTTAAPSATTAVAKTGSAVSTGGTTAGRIAATPRLSIGKYVGAPKALSSSGGVSSDLEARVEKLETDVDRLETDKQDALSDSTYITIQGDQVILEIERVREELCGEDGCGGENGRDIEFSYDDTGLYWNYVGDTETNEVITWEELREKLDIEGAIADAVADLKTELDGKYVLMDQTTANAGKILVVGDDGIVTPTEIEIPTADDFYTKDEVDDIVDDIYDDMDDGLDGKVDKDQGIGEEGELIGRALVVGDDGILRPTGEFATQSDLEDLGDLAYLDEVGSDEIKNESVTTEKLANTAVEREKLATEIVTTLDGASFWETWWNEHQDELASGDYVVAVGPGTNADNPPRLFRIITAEDEVDSPTPAPTPSDPDTDEP